MPSAPIRIIRIFANPRVYRLSTTGTKVGQVRCQGHSQGHTGAGLVSVPPRWCKPTGWGHCLHMFTC